MVPQCRLRLVLSVVVCALLNGPDASSADNSIGASSSIVSKPADTDSAPIFVEPGSQVTATLYSDGTQLNLATEVAWRPFCGSGVQGLTKAGLAELSRTTRELKEAWLRTNEDRRPFTSGARSGPDIVFNYLTPPPAEAIPALAEVEAYVESQFTDPVTIEIDLDFAELAPNILGVTGAVRIPDVSWSMARAAIINDMDDDDLIQLALPLETVPVRYDANSDTVTNETVVTFTHAQFQATVGALTGTAATVTINSNFDWDYSPPDIDVGKHCFQSVLIHEIGHVMGFETRADYEPNLRIEVMDVFRFQRTDGTGDWNPDSLFDLTHVARTVDYNNLNDDVNTDLILDEYRMADGSPYQAAHFRPQTPSVCLMDPTLEEQETFYPNFFRSCDLAVLDAIGWDRVGTAAPPLSAPYPENRRKNRYISFDPNPANSGIPVAFLVSIEQIDLASCDGNGARCRLDHGDDDCNACSVSGAPCIGLLDCAQGESCDPTGDTCVKDLARSAFDLDKRAWWIGQPDEHNVAHLVGIDHRFVSDHWPAVVHIGDCEIVPRATYGIRTYDFTDLSASELLVETIARPGNNYWADVVGPRSYYCDGDERNELCDPENNVCPEGQPCTALWSVPNGATNFDDVGAALFAFQAASGQTLPDIKSVDLHGNELGNAWVDPPNYVVNFADVQFIVLAFQGRPYPFVDPANCPDVP